MAHHVPGRMPDPVGFRTHQLLDGCNSELCMVNVFNCHRISHQIVLNHQYCGEYDDPSIVMSSAANLGLSHFNAHKVVRYIVVHYLLCLSRYLGSLLILPSYHSKYFG
jgi:hypothetical protein